MARKLRGALPGGDSSLRNAVWEFMQLTDLKRHHRAEIARLETALAAAQGENLQLRRQLGRQGQPAAA